jgi:hypothetical protein
MIDNLLLAQILNKAPHQTRKDWFKDRADKIKGLNVVDKNLKVSRIIDNLNKKIRG